MRISIYIVSMALIFFSHNAVALPDQDLLDLDNGSQIKTAEEETFPIIDEEDCGCSAPD